MDRAKLFQKVADHYRAQQPRWLYTETNLTTYADTVALIQKWAIEFQADLEIFPRLGLSIYDVFLYSRWLEYHSDPKGLESVSRPLITMNPDWNGPRDCDDKTLQILAACPLYKIPARPIVIGQRENPHHIYPEIQPPGSSIWIPADATYRERSLFGVRLYTEVFRREFAKI